MTKIIRDWFANYNLIILDEIDSTNDEARRLARDGVTGDFIVWAKQQTKGKGRYGKQWVSPEGNLYLSLLLTSITDVNRASELSFVTAVAVGEALMALTSREKVGYKWPNDILFNGKKLGGILLESEVSSRNSELDFMVIGLGINIKHFPEKVDYPATSLLAEDYADIISDQLLDTIMQHFCYWLGQWQSQGFSVIRQTWLQKAINLGNVITVNTPNERLSGVFETLREDGSLELKLAGGQICLISSGEVFF
jgi:BirA family transcriptional regulator, biotin operon repressor / biotin---[acetyl-CoA-carboxylase] ligase